MINNDHITIKTSLLEIKTDRPILENAEKLRGYISGKFLEYPTFHNHLGGDQYIYTYPRIQYKVIDGVAYILGIEEGAKLIKMISEIDKLYLGENIYNVKQKIFYDKDEKMMSTRELLQYDIVTPLLMLNRENYLKFKVLKDQKEKKMMINDILRGNVISMSKGLSFDVEQDIYIHSKINEIRTKYKGMTMSGFVGEFRTNFIIPNLFGLGRKTSTGFGVVKSRNIE